MVMHEARSHTNIVKINKFDIDVMLDIINNNKKNAYEVTNNLNSFSNSIRNKSPSIWTPSNSLCMDITTQPSNKSSLKALTVTWSSRKPSPAQVHPNQSNNSNSSSRNWSLSSLPKTRFPSKLHKLKS